MLESDEQHNILFLLNSLLTRNSETHFFLSESKIVSITTEIGWRSCLVHFIKFVQRIINNTLTLGSRIPDFLFPEVKTNKQEQNKNKVGLKKTTNSWEMNWENSSDRRSKS